MYLDTTLKKRIDIFYIMEIHKLFCINIFLLHFFLVINEKILAEEINIKLPYSNNFNNIRFNVHTIEKSKNKINFNKVSNTKSYFIKNHSPVNNNKINIVEQEIIKNFNKHENLTTKKQSSPHKEYKSNFKDYSSTFLSPYGGHVPRAPDESLKACNTKKCYE